MLEKVLAISGKPGLYKLISRGNRNLIVESMDSLKRRRPAFATERVISVADISMYTYEEDVPIRVAFQNIFNKENGAKCSLNYSKATKEEIFAYMDEILPGWDKERVHLSDIKKLLQWYDILIENEVTDFEEKKDEQEDAS